MLSDISQSQKDKYCMIHLLEVPEGVRFIETESGMMGARHRGWGWGECLMGMEFLLGRMENSGDG